MTQRFNQRLCLCRGSGRTSSMILVCLYVASGLLEVWVWRAFVLIFVVVIGDILAVVLRAGSMSTLMSTFSVLGSTKLRVARGGTFDCMSRGGCGVGFLA